MRDFFFYLLLSLLAAQQAQAASPITAAAFTPDGKQVLVGSQGGIEVRSWPELKTVAALQTSLAHVNDLSFSPNGRRLLVAGGSPAEQGAVELLSWPDGKVIQRVADHDDLVYHVAWAPDGKHWAAASADGTCQVYAAESGKPLTRYAGHSQAALSLCFLSDSQTLASTSTDQTMQLWNGITGKSLRTLDNHVAAVNAIALQPNRQNHADPSQHPDVIATISEDRTLRLWRPSIGRLLRFVRLPSIPRALAWSASGDRMYVGCNDGHVRVILAENMEIADDLAGSVGRIHELLYDSERKLVLIAGENGCRTLETKQP